MLGDLFPVFKCCLILPIADRNAQTVGTARRLDPDKAGLRGRKVRHAGRHFLVAVIASRRCAVKITA